MRNLIFSFILFFLICSFSNVVALSDIYSNNVILYNVDEDKVMYEKNADERAYIASLTKIMTAMVVLDEESNLDKEISLKGVDYDFLREKDLAISSFDRKKNYTYRDFLYSLVMESSADCGYALANDVSSDFPKLMNDMAKRLGMDDSSFSNPVGLDEVSNQTTMRDMLILMRSALDNDSLKNMMSTFRYKVSSGEIIYHTIYSYIKTYDLDMPYLKGGKTGNNDIPGYALMSYACKGDSCYILITTNASFEYGKPKHLMDAKRIYEYYFKNYKYYNVIDKGDELVRLDTKYLNLDKIVIKSFDDVKIFHNKSFNKKYLSLKYKGIKVVTPKYKKNDFLGDVDIYYKNKLIKSVPVYLDVSPKVSFLGFFGYYRNLIIAGICYILIFVFTFVIVRKIRNRKKPRLF